MRLMYPPLQPLRLESLASLMERLRRANFYEEANWLQDLLPSPTRAQLNLVRLPKDLERLHELTTLPTEVLRRLTVHRFAACYRLPTTQQQNGENGETEPFRGWDASGLALYVHGQPASKLCPLCWREQRAVLLPWSLRQVTTCALHQVLLVDTCSHCGKQLAINWAKGTCRQCRQSVAKLPVVPVTHHHASWALTQVVWSALAIGEEPFFPASLSLAAEHPLQKMCAPALLQFFWHFGQFLIGRDPHSPLFDPATLLPGTSWTAPPAILRQASVAEVHGVLTALWHLLEGWPATWEMTLERLVELEGPFATDAPERLPNLLTTQFGAPEFAWMYRGWEDFMWKHRDQTPSLYPWFRHWRRTQQQQEVRMAHPLLSQREAARRLHTEERTLKRFLAWEQLRTPPPTPASAAPQRQWQLVETESVETLQHTLESQLSLKQAAMVCGLSEKLVLALVEAGLLPAGDGQGQDQTPVWHFCEQDLQEALMGLLEPLSPDPPAELNDHLLSLSQTLRIVSAASIRLPALLQAVKAGKLAGFRLHEPATLGTIRFERSQVLAFLTEQRSPERREEMSIEEVCRMLHCKDTTLRRWHDSGLLMPCKEQMHGTKRNWWYRRQDIATFAERYVTAEAAAEILDCTALTIQRCTRAGQLAAITGPDIDGSHAYRFEKQALITWHQERLTSREACTMLGISSPTLHRWVQEGKVTPLTSEKGKHRWFARSEILQHTAQLPKPRPFPEEVVSS